MTFMPKAEIASGLLWELGKTDRRRAWEQWGAYDRKQGPLLRRKTPTLAWFMLS